ncbi:unnamed protein product [Heligmosomoides polygyrus]|uniref:Uncharacterized protein n=1 Tax=Heligmosomoides polygyrus TaxID=6339 RepID=A0A3P7V1S2_HELPZ|nr:unnamed protein product [Heligmosomoides polygyrus]
MNVRWMLKKQFQLRIRVVDAALASLLALPKPAFKSLNSIATMDATFPPSLQWTTRTWHHNHYLSKDELDDLRNNVNVGCGEQPAFKSLNSIATMDATFPPSVQWTTRTCHHNHYLSKDELDDLRNNVNAGFGEELNVRWMLKKQFQLRIRVVDAALASLLDLQKPALKWLNSTATLDATFPSSLQRTTRTWHYNHYLSKDELDDLRNNVNVGCGEQLNFR